MKKSEKTHQGLYNVGFIGFENKAALRTTLFDNGPTLIENSLKTSAGPTLKRIANGSGTSNLEAFAFVMNAGAAYEPLSFSTQ